MAARWAIVLVCVLLAGCGAPPSTDPAPSPSPSNGVIRSDTGEVESSLPYQRVSGTGRPTRDPNAPPVTMDGARTFALGILIREAPPGAPVRHACGGAVVATPEGWPDPRGSFDAFRLVGSQTIHDAAGRAWTTDRYAAKENASSYIWVQNVGGGTRFLPDDGGDCPAPRFGSGPLNILLHIEGADRVDLRYSPSTRPAPRDAMG